MVLVRLPDDRAPPDEVARLRAENRALRDELARLAAARGAEADRSARETLAREADHRVKNSLQMVASMLRLQAARHGHPILRDQLRQAAERVQAIAAVHALLQRDAEARVDFAGLAAELCAALTGGLGDADAGAAVAVACEPAPMRAETARAAALVLCELVANALRHAFGPGAPGQVEVTGARMADRSYRLTVADRGRGLPDAFTLEGDGLGLRLVRMLAAQLDARLDVSGGGGARFDLTIPASRL